MKVYDDVLGKASLTLLQSEIITNRFPWNFHVTTERKKNYSPFDYSFVHIVQRDDEITSSYFGVIFPIVLGMFERVGIEFEKITRLRLALQTPMGREYINEPHIDDTIPHKAAIFYLNDSDGSTLLYANRYDPRSELTAREYKLKIGYENFLIAKEVEPKANRLLVFDGFNYHSSQRPLKYHSRIILNINFN